MFSRYSVIFLCLPFCTVLVGCLALWVLSGQMHQNCSALAAGIATNYECSIHQRARVEQTGGAWWFSVCVHWLGSVTWCSLNDSLLIHHPLHLCFNIQNMLSATGNAEVWVPTTEKNNRCAWDEIQLFQVHANAVLLPTIILCHFAVMVLNLTPASTQGCKATRAFPSACSLQQVSGPVL